MHYFVIGDEETVLGLGMAGVNGHTVTDAQEARTALTEAIGDRDVGIVIITEAVAAMIRTLVDKYVFTQSFPLIVEIPDRTGRLPDKPGIRELVNRTIGLKL
ncbi:MAG: V-type ATP synthase subunit F [Chitinispirillaceae bacterium]|nr:V-type ATP synthase subunit F [Chitinispirillaceae bacterium]